jgi:hypothetical protein
MFSVNHQQKHRFNIPQLINNMRRKAKLFFVKIIRTIILERFCLLSLMQVKNPRMDSMRDIRRYRYDLRDTIVMHMSRL